MWHGMALALALALNLLLSSRLFLKTLDILGRGFGYVPDSRHGQRSTPDSIEKFRNLKHKRTSSISVRHRNNVYHNGISHRHKHEAKKGEEREEE